MSVDAYGMFSKAESREAEIKIYEESIVSNGKMVRLGEISHIQGLPPELLRDLNQITIAQVKNSKNEIVISARSVSKLLRSYLVEIEKNQKITIKTRIPNKIKIISVASRVTKESIVQKLNRSLKQECSECIYEVKLNPVDISPKNLVGWDIKLNQPIRGSFNVPIDLVYRNQRMKSVWVSGLVKSYRYYPVSRRLIRRGKVLSEDDFSFQLREATYDSDGQLRNDDIIGQEVSKTLVAGERIHSHVLNSPILVKFGDTVKVESGNSVMKVFVDGIVQQSARKGQTIRIKIPRTKKIVNAEVIDRGMVRIR